MSRYRPLADIDHLVIHCAATPNGRHVTIEEIDRWHRQRGFHRDAGLRRRCEPHLLAVGYHFVIYTDGTVQRGRWLCETGAHTKGWNRRSVGVCLVGTDRFTRFQWRSLDALVGAMLCIFGDSLTIVGHRELPGVHKDCPGFDVASWCSRGFRPVQDHILEEENP